MKTKITDTVEQMIQYKLEGLTNVEIASKFDCSKTAINKYFQKIGFDYKTKTAIITTQQELDATKSTVHKGYQPKNIDVNKVIELHNQGYMDSEIADMFGCSRPNITYHLNRNGITNRKSKINNIPLRNKISNTLKGKMIGDKNPNYKGYTTEKQIARGLFKTISNEMIRNSGYHCHICGKKSQVYHTHHIKPFALILNEFLTNVYSGNIDTFTEEILQYFDFINTKNLIVICPECHKQIHYSDNPELNPYRWKSVTTIENIQEDEAFLEEVSRVESSDSKCEES